MSQAKVVQFNQHQWTGIVIDGNNAVALCLPFNYLLTELYCYIDADNVDNVRFHTLRQQSDECLISLSPDGERGACSLYG